MAENLFKHRTFILAIILVLILIIAGIFLYTAKNMYKISYVGTYQLGSFNIYVYNVYGNLYACSQNISGEQCLIAKNTLICGDTSCVQIYDIVNVS